MQIRTAEARSEAIKKSKGSCVLRGWGETKDAVKMKAMRLYLKMISLACWQWKNFSRQLMNTIWAHCLYYFSKPRAVCAFYHYVFLGKDFLSGVSLYFFPPCCTTVLLSCDVLFSAPSADSLPSSLQIFHLKSQCVFHLLLYKVWVFQAHYNGSDSWWGQAVGNTEPQCQTVS